MYQLKDGTTSIFLWYPSLILNRRGGTVVGRQSGDQREKVAIKNLLQYSSISTGILKVTGWLCSIFFDIEYIRVGLM